MLNEKGIIIQLIVGLIKSILNETTCKKGVNIFLNHMNHLLEILMSSLISVIMQKT